MSGWIGIDLDGTLAHYAGWNDGKIGEPIPATLARVKRWLSEGQEVRIFTARVGRCESSLPLAEPAAQQTMIDEQRALIEAWCLQHLGQKLPVTATKDYAMIALYDDRAIQVIPNTGQRVDGLPL